MKIVIVGNGFGGIKTALELANKSGFEVSLISPHFNFEYHAALYRSATGWSPKEVVLPLRDIFKDKSVDLIQDTVTAIDIDKHIIKGEDGRNYNYDRAIFSIGQVINFFGIEGMAEYSHSMGDIAHTIALRQHLKEQALSEDKELKFVVIGGGATGVELAGEIKPFINRIISNHHAKSKKIEVVLIEGSNRLLSLLAPKISKIAETRLIEIGVKVMLNTIVKGCNIDEVKLENEVIKTHCVIWTAGFANNPFFANHEGSFKLARNGKVEVDEYLLANKDVYVIGDSSNTQYSGMAQTALFDAIFVANNLEREIRNQTKKMYVPKRPIYVVPVGQKFAVLQWGRFILYGKPAWYMRRLADLRLFDEFEPLGKAIKAWRSGTKRAKWLES